MADGANERHMECEVMGRRRWIVTAHVLMGK